MTLVDSDVLIDLLFRDPIWFHWSKTMLARRAEMGPLVIADPTFSEISLGFASAGDVETALRALAISRMPASAEALHAAAQAFRRYRAAGGKRTGMLAHFTVGACAQSAGIPVLTRDRQHYSEYFPGVELISP